MPPAGFEHTISTGEQLQTHVLDPWDRRGLHFGSHKPIEHTSKQIFLLKDKKILSELKVNIGYMNQNYIHTVASDVDNSY
jgi:hypothetical protein